MLFRQAFSLLFKILLGTNNFEEMIFCKTKLKSYSSTQLSYGQSNLEQIFVVDIIVKGTLYISALYYSNVMYCRSL